MAPTWTRAPARRTAKRRSMRPRNGIELADQAAALAAQKAAMEARKAERAAWRKANPLAVQQ